MPRIVFELTSLGYGGGTTYIKELLSAMTPDRFSGSVDLLLRAENTETLEVLPPMIRILNLGKGLENYFTRAAAQRWILPRLVRILGAEVVFAVGATALRPGGACPFRMVTSLRNMLPFEPAQLRKFGRWSRMGFILRMKRHAILTCMRHSNRHIFISAYSRDRVLPLVPHLKNRHALIPNGIPPTFLHAPTPCPERVKELTGQVDPYALYVSILDPYKNHIPLLQGYAAARRQGFNLPLILAGPAEAPYATPVLREIQKLQLNEWVRVLGAVPQRDIPELMKGADLLIYGSTCETCPFILLEYLPAGKPILCSDAQPMPEFGGDACHYVDASSPESWREGLLLLYRSPALRAELGEAARLRCPLYSMEKMVSETLKVLTDW